MLPIPFERVTAAKDLRLDKPNLTAIPLWSYRKVYPDTLCTLFNQQFVKVLFRLVADVE